MFASCLYSKWRIIWSLQMKITPYEWFPSWCPRHLIFHLIPWINQNRRSVILSTTPRSSLFLVLFKHFKQKGFANQLVSTIQWPYENTYVHSSTQFCHMILVNDLIFLFNVCTIDGSIFSIFSSTPMNFSIFSAISFSFPQNPK